MTLDLNEEEMLIEDKDISKSVDGMYNVFTYTPTNTSIQYQWSGIKKGSELPVQVVQRNDEGVVVDVFDFETDETSYWKAIKKFEELIEEKTKEQEEQKVDEEHKKKKTWWKFWKKEVIESENIKPETKKDKIPIGKSCKKCPRTTPIILKGIIIINKIGWL